MPTTAWRPLALVVLILPAERQAARGSPSLVFHPPVATDPGSGWGDTLFTLATAERWNESVVFSWGGRNMQQGGFVAVSTSGGARWDRGSLQGDGGNWSAALCAEDTHTFSPVLTASGRMHTFGSARGSGATVGSYSSWNSSSVSFIERVKGAPPLAAARARCEARPVTFKGLPTPVFCNQTGPEVSVQQYCLSRNSRPGCVFIRSLKEVLHGEQADCFWTTAGASVRLADGSFLQTTAVPWLGGEFGPSAASSGVFVFRSLDSFDWRYLATVACAADFPNSGEGPNENAMALTSTGGSSGAERLMVVMRMDGNDGTAWVRSAPLTCVSTYLGTGHKFGTLRWAGVPRRAITRAKITTRRLVLRLAARGARRRRCAM